MIVALLLIVAGLVGPVALVQWRRGQWLEAARWIGSNISGPAVAAAPLLGVLVSFVGLMLIWPPAVLFTLLAAVALLAVLRTASRPGGNERLQSLGLPTSRVSRPDRRARSVS